MVSLYIFMNIIQVDLKNRKQVDDFLRLPFSIYREVPQWVPALQMDERFRVTSMANDAQEAREMLAASKRHPELVDAVGHPPGAPHVAAGEPGLLVEAGLKGDEAPGHEPVDLVPGGDDVGGRGLAEGLGDRGEQVLVHDHVLVLGDSEGDVLVRDAREQGVGALVRVVEETGGEGGHGTGQGPALLAAGLVAAVEQAVEEFGTLAQHGLVEPGGDGVQCSRDGGDGGADGGRGLGGEHASSFAGTRAPGQIIGISNAY